MNNWNKLTNNANDFSSDLHCISIESDHNQNDCTSTSSHSIVDDQHKQHSNSNAVNKSCDQHFCQTASTSLQHYSEDYIQMINEEKERDHQIDAIIDSILESRQSDSDYNDSNDSSDDSDHIIDEVNDSDAKNWTRNVLLPPTEDEEYLESEYSLDPIEFQLDACLRYRSDPSLKVPLPFESMSRAFGFNNKFLDRLKKLECNPPPIQLHSWPCILKGFSLSCISGPKTGKTNTYLIPLMCWFDSNEPDNEVKVGAIVICSSTRKTLQIAREARQWRATNENSKVRIVSMNSSNEKRQMTAILNGCDILITTPLPLLRCIESHIIDSKNTRCLILDDAHCSLALHRKAILDIYLAFALSRKQNHTNNTENQNHNNSMAFQTMLFSEKWTKDVQWFYKEVQHIPVLLFASYLEATIALNISCNIEFIEREEDRERCLKELLKRVDHKQRIAIVCRSLGEIRYLRRVLNLPINKSIVVTEETNHYDLSNYSNRWKNTNKYLFITDTAAKTLTGFDSSKCIIHYKLPYDFNDNFGDRFRLMKSYFKACKSPLNHENTKDLVNYVLVSPADRDLIPELVSYLKRLNVRIPDSISRLYEINRRKLCPYYSSFGKCPIVSINCFDRHLFNEFDKPNSQLPENGQIKIIISYVVGTNEFFIRINEFRGQSSGNWEKMSLTFDEIKPKLNEFLNTDFNTLKNFSEDEIYGIAVRGEVLRVRLTRVLEDEKIHYYQEYDPNDASKMVELFCIDYGHKFYSRSRQLFALSYDLKSLPPFAHRAYLFGIKPVDNEIEWDFKSTQKFYELIDNYRISEITAWVLKQVDGVFWLNRLIVKKRLKNAKACIGSNPIETLLEEKLALKNNIILPEFNSDYNKIVNIWHKNRLNRLSYYSHLSDESTYVVVSDFVSLDEIYVTHENRVKRLECLENKLYSEIDSLEPQLEFSEDQLCLCKYGENSINRAKILSINDNESVTVFCVDHGDILHNISKSSIYRIKDHHLKELPFQAIKVRLFGVKALKTIDYDLICDLTRNKEEEYLLVIAQKINYENAIYTVRLFVAKDENESQFVALSKLLVDLNYAQYVDGEENNEHSLTINRATCDQSDNEIQDDYLEHLENQMIDQFCKQFILQSFGLKEEENIDNREEVKEEKTEKKESKMSKIMKRLKMIKQKNKVLTQNNDDSANDEEEETKPNRFPQFVNYKPGDFDYEVGDGVSYYDPEDKFDQDSLHSDEDVMFDEDDELFQ